MIKWLFSGLKTLRVRATDTYYRRFGKFGTLEIADIPTNPIAGKLYLVGDGLRPWIAAMRCPCGCGEVLEMNLLPDAEPVWRLDIDPNNRPTLDPSVWRRDGCRAHFFLRRGIIRRC